MVDTGKNACLWADLMSQGCGRKSSIDGLRGIAGGVSSSYGDGTAEEEREKQGIEAWLEKQKEQENECSCFWGCGTGRKTASARIVPRIIHGVEAARNYSAEVRY